MKGRGDEAMAEFRKAIGFDPKYAPAHNGLGLVLRDKGQRDDAIAEFRKAIGLDPKSAEIHSNLGLVVRDRTQAVAEFRLAIELDPKLSAAHNNLGSALRDLGELDEAILEYQLACKLDPKNGLGHYNLANARRDKGQVVEAVAEYRTAIDLWPNYAEAHCNLGHVLREQGDFAGALAELKRGDEIGSRSKDWQYQYQSKLWVKHCERLTELDQRLPAILKGEAQPASVAERLEFARVCKIKKLYAAAVKLYSDSFSTDPKLAEYLNTLYRFNAACSAAMAGAGQGNDDGTLDDQEKARFRRQAVEWLLADLLACTKSIASGDAHYRALVEQHLQPWQQNRDLASLRDAEALAKLPAAEREACRKLWADVAALLQKARGK
jgi:eukaryotic-like serine/threonine-protein kinase